MYTFHIPLRVTFLLGLLLSMFSSKRVIRDQIHSCDRWQRQKWREVFWLCWAPFAEEYKTSKGLHDVEVWFVPPPLPLIFCLIFLLAHRFGHGRVAILWKTTNTKVRWMLKQMSLCFSQLVSSSQSVLFQQMDKYRIYFTLYMYVCGWIYVTQFNVTHFLFFNLQVL